jgi:putative ABC transport system substrate-binding protein
MLRRPVAPLLVVALVLVASNAVLAAGRPTVLVVKSQELGAYSQVVAGFAAEVDAEVSTITLPESADGAEKAMERALAQRPSLVLALGPNAASLSRRLGSEIPTLFAMVPYYEKYGLEGPKVTGIALTGDFAAELATLQAVFPQAKRVGVLHDPRLSGKTLEELKPVAASKGLTIVPLAVENPARTEAVLKGGSKRIDALLMIADKTVSNAAIVRQQIRFAEEQKLPLVALSGSQVKEGATLSLSASYVGIGQQSGRLANRIVHEKIDAGALAVARPETLDLAVNLAHLNSLGNGGALALELLRFSARQGHLLKAYP